MGIINSKALYQSVFDKECAIGGFCTYDMEMMQSVVRAAELERSPVLLQASCRVIDYAGAKMLRKMAEACAEETDIPLVLHLDHGDTVERCKECIDQGFTSVMLDCTGKSFEEAVEMTSQVTEYAHRYHATVEGEICHPVDQPILYITDVDEAVEFVKRTGCDSLSVCCGNAHDQAPELKKRIDFERLSEIHKALPDVPLVLHATTVFTDQMVERLNEYGAEYPHYCNFAIEDIQKTMSYGVCKINAAMDIKITTTRSIREYMCKNPGNVDPRAYLGYARDEVRDYVRMKIRDIFRSSGLMEKREDCSI